MGVWSETLESAQEDVRHELAGMDAREARGEMYQIVDSIADSHVPVYFSAIFEMILDARLSSTQPENPPEDASPESISRIVIYEELQNKLVAYAEQFIEDSEVCADGHLMGEDAETTECEHCGDSYCSDRDHGRACEVCREPTCVNCRAWHSNYGKWVCDDCDERLTEEDEAAEADAEDDEEDESEEAEVEASNE